MRFFDRLFRKKSKQARLTDLFDSDTRSPFELSLEQWRQNEELVLASKRLALDPTFRAMLDVMRNENPIHLKLPKLGVQPSDRISHLGEVEGYQLAINNLAAFAVPIGSREPLVATFEPSEQESEQQNE